MKLFQVLLMCTVTCCLFGHDIVLKDRGVSTNWNYQHFSQRHLLNEECSLTCHHGRLRLPSCDCRCWRNWSGIRCHERVCKPWQKSCDEKKKCVNKLRFCDGKQNCQDGSDEQGCGCTKSCSHGGKLRTQTCTCLCTAMWTGDICRTPSPIANCGNRPVDNSRIVGGQAADIKLYPWQVQLRYRFTYTRHWSFFCGGTLVSHLHVVTAAHCVTDMSTNRWKIYLGRTKLQSGGEKVRQVKAVFIHEKYESLSGGNDIALMEFDIPVTYTHQIQPACLHRAVLYRFNSESACFISGWGSFGTGGTLPNTLQAAQLVLIPKETCADIFHDFTDGMICASESLQILGKVDTCQGDSGGPLACAAVDSNGFLQWHLVGITSFGYGCGVPGAPGVYTEVSDYIDWLDEKFNTEL